MISFYVSMWQAQKLVKQSETREVVKKSTFNFTTHIKCCRSPLLKSALPKKGNYPEQDAPGRPPRALEPQSRGAGDAGRRPAVPFQIPPALGKQGVLGV